MKAASAFNVLPRELRNMLPIWVMWPDYFNDD
jgi:hypothetical protein